MSGVYIVIATMGRAGVLCQTVAYLKHQTVSPELIIVSATKADDVTGVELAGEKIEVILGSPGSCIQRNRALDLLPDDAEVVVFLDDDFVAHPNYLENVVAALSRNPGLVGVSGRVLADGARSGGIAFDTAVEMVESVVLPSNADIVPCETLYGCNMAAPWSVAKDLRFDEQLPLYGWLEDQDYSTILGRHGRLAGIQDAVGVHMATRSGRTSGVRLGYSQVANPLYLHQKGLISRPKTLAMILHNLTSNTLRSIRPETTIDRRGRLKGNMTALRHLLSRRIHPRNVINL